MPLRYAKRAVLEGMRAWGVFQRAARSAWRRKRLLILCYHSFSLDDEHQWRPGLYLEASFLEERLRILEEWGASVLPLEEAIPRLYDGSLPPLAVCLTFDDGTADFQRLVLPLLKRQGYPATLYMSTYYSEARKPVFHLMLSYLLWKGRGRMLRAEPAMGIEEEANLGSPSEREQVREAILRFARERGLEADERDDLAGCLARRLGIDYQALLDRRILQLMTPDEVASVARAGIRVELHTHRHRTPLDRALFVREITENRARLEAMTGATPRHFCYPSGFWRPEFLPWLQQEDVLSATTCEPGLASARSDRLLLPRLVEVGSMPRTEFEAWLVGIGGLLWRR